MTTRSYDYLNRLQNVTSQPSATGTLGLNTGYQYNDANQRTRQWASDGTYWAYQYDALGQVIAGKRYFGDGTPVPGSSSSMPSTTSGTARRPAAGPRP